MFNKNELYPDVVVECKLVLEKDVVSTVFAAPGSIRFTPDNKLIMIETWRNGASGKNYSKGVKVQHDLLFFANYLISMNPEIGATWDKVEVDDETDDDKPARPAPKKAKTAKPAPKKAKGPSKAKLSKARSAALKAVKVAHAGASQECYTSALDDAAQNVGNPADVETMTDYAMRIVCKAQVYTDLTERGVEMPADDWAAYWELVDEQAPNYGDFDETLAVLEETIWPSDA